MQIDCPYRLHLRTSLQYKELQGRKGDGLKKVALSLIIAICALLPNPASATPSNIIRIPSADIQPYGTLRLGIDNNTTFGIPPSTGGAAMPVTYGITAGTFDAIVLQTEVGIDMREVSEQPLSFNAKLCSPEGSINDLLPGICFGGYDFGSETDVTDNNILYGAVAKTISFFGRFTVGYFIGNEKLLVNRNGQVDNEGIMFAFDRRMPDVNEKLWFGLDFMATNSKYGAESWGLGWSFSETSALTIAYVRYNDPKVSPVGDNLVSLQVDFDF